MVTLADLKELVVVFVAGLFVGWVLREVTGVKAGYSNVERWGFVKDEFGRVTGVEVKREAH